MREPANSLAKPQLRFLFPHSSPRSREFHPFGCLFAMLYRLSLLVGRNGSVWIACVLFGAITTHAATAASPVVGVNAPMGSLTIEQQNINLANLHAAGVHYIRAGITPDEKGVDFARRAREQGIRILWLVQLQYRPDATIRPWPNAFNTWGGPPLAAADPEQFPGIIRASVLETRQYGRALFAHGIQLGWIQSENLEDRRSDLRRLDERSDGTGLERRIGY